jgi:hypothetical protein
MQRRILKKGQAVSLPSGFYFVYYAMLLDITRHLMMRQKLQGIINLGAKW